MTYKATQLRKSTSLYHPSGDYGVKQRPESMSKEFLTAFRRINYITRSIIGLQAAEDIAIMPFTVRRAAPASPPPEPPSSDSDDSQDSEGDTSMLETRPSKRIKLSSSSIVTPGEIVTDDPQWMRCAPASLLSIHFTSLLSPRRPTYTLNATN